jgi:hypothetical protein
MLVETIVATFLLIWPAFFFFSIDLHNVLVAHRSSSSVRSYAEVDHPTGVASGSAVLGTTAYFFEASFYPKIPFGQHPWGKTPRKTVRRAISRMSKKNWPISPRSQDASWMETKPELMHAC